MKTNNKTWKPVTISGFTGILMGAGAMHVAQNVDLSTSANEETEQLAVAKTHDDLSFREAFDAARAEMGPGGVFRWHGNLYNTYTADEWQAMSESEKDEFAERIAPEVSPADIDTDLVAANEEVEDTENADVVVAEESNDDANLTAANDQPLESGDDDVRVVGFGEVTLDNGRNVTVQEIDVNGQRVAVIDLDQDGEADIAMSDLNNNREMDDGEVIDLHTGDTLSFTNDEAPVEDTHIDTFDA